MNRTIVLNGDFSFLNTVSWRRGLILVMTGKSEVLKYADKAITCANGSVFNIPLVIRLIKVIRMIYKNRVPYSKKNIMVRDGYKCVYCGSKDELTIDHMVPSSRGGKTSFENCVTACRSCNNKKNNRTPSEAKMFTSKIPHAPTISEFFRIKMKQLGVDECLREWGVF
jgi:5-methylcytosine-specific restriction endonuclease McrA